jgi:hypothetical protein
MNELKLQMTATILSAHVRHGYNISDPTLVGSAMDAAEAIFAENERRQKAAKEKKPEPEKKPEQPPKP